MFKYIVILGAIAQLLGMFSYIKETLKGNIKPNKVSWLMWSLAPIIGSVAAFSSGVRWAVLPIFMSGIGPLILFIVSFINPKSYWKLEIFDYLCGACSLLALILWAITKQPLIAIIFSILSDGFAAIPTLIKCWKFPKTERVYVYVTSLFSATTSFFAINSWKPTEYLFPTYWALMCIIFITIFYRDKIILFKKYANS